MSPAPPARIDRAGREQAPRALRKASRSIGGALGGAVMVVLATAIVTFAAAAAWNDIIDWRSIVALTRVAARSEPVPAPASAPVVREPALPLPRRGETALIRARALTARGRLREALTALDAVTMTDPQKPDADRLRAEIQQQLLALTPVPSGEAPDQEKGERRTR